MTGDYLGWNGKKNKCFSNMINYHTSSWETWVSRGTEKVSKKGWVVFRSCEEWKKPKLQMTDKHRATAFKRDRMTHNGLWGCWNIYKRGPTPASRHKQHTHSPAGQHHPFLIPPAQRRRGESSAPARSPHPRAGPGWAAPPEPPGRTLGPGPALGRHGTGRAPRASQRAPQLVKAAGAVGNTN